MRALLLVLLLPFLLAYEGNSPGGLDPIFNTAGTADFNALPNYREANSSVALIDQIGDQDGFDWNSALAMALATHSKGPVWLSTLGFRNPADAQINCAAGSDYSLRIYMADANGYSAGDTLNFFDEAAVDLGYDTTIDTINTTGSHYIDVTMEVDDDEAVIIGDTLEGQSITEVEGRGPYGLCYAQRVKRIADRLNLDLSHITLLYPGFKFWAFDPVSGWDKTVCIDANFSRADPADACEGGDWVTFDPDGDDDTKGTDDDWVFYVTGDKVQEREQEFLDDADHDVFTVASGFDESYMDAQSHADCWDGNGTAGSLTVLDHCWMVKLTINDPDQVIVQNAVVRLEQGMATNADAFEWAAWAYFGAMIQYTDWWPHAKGAASGPKAGWNTLASFYGGKTTTVAPCGVTGSDSWHGPAAATGMTIGDTKDCDGFSSYWRDVPAAAQRTAFWPEIESAFYQRVKEICDGYSIPDHQCLMARNSRVQSGHFRQQGFLGTPTSVEDWWLGEIGDRGTFCEQANDGCYVPHTGPTHPQEPTAAVGAAVTLAIVADETCSPLLLFRAAGGTPAPATDPEVAGNATLIDGMCVEMTEGTTGIYTACAAAPSHHSEFAETGHGAPACAGGTVDEAGDAI